MNPEDFAIVAMLDCFRSSLPQCWAQSDAVSSIDRDDFQATLTEETAS
jgi:hypothetical protein